MDSQLFVKAYNLIKSSNNILVATHEYPDGDALASICLMAEILNGLNKKYQLYCRSRINGQYNFLPRLEEITDEIPPTDYDLIITLDCGSFERTKLSEEILDRSGGRLIMEIDHHPRVRAYTDLELRDPSAAATTEILYYLLQANKIKLDKNSANCVLTGILTDTGNFLYPSTSSATISIASEMLRLGARLPQIIENTWRNKSVASMKTWGLAMSNLQINKKYNFAFTVLRSEDVPAGISEDELEGLAGFISNLNEINGLMLLREMPDGSIKGSLRTAKPNLDISRLANVLGGGGHAKAAGFMVEGKLERTKNGWKII